MSPEPVTRFEASDLRRFLTAVDRHLGEPATMTLLGGSAIALYGVQGGTTDIDTWETDLSKLKSAIALAETETGLDIPVSSTGVADVPYHYEDRLQVVEGEWTRLQVRLLERHDLALSKMMRADENDLVAVAKLHKLLPLELETLVARYLDEMQHAIGNRSRLDQHFLLLIERLYGEIAADRVEERLRRTRRKRT
jgi:hypothetical protein